MKKCWTLAAFIYILGDSAVAAEKPTEELGQEAMIATIQCVKLGSYYQEVANAKIDDKLSAVPGFAKSEIHTSWAPSKAAEIVKIIYGMPIESIAGRVKKLADDYSYDCAKEQIRRITEERKH